MSSTTRGNAAPLSSEGAPTLALQGVEARLPFNEASDLGHISERAASAARRVEQVFRRVGLEGESAFYAVAAAYAAEANAEIPTIARRGREPLARVWGDPEGRVLLRSLTESDPTAVTAPVIYQHFLGARFRRNSGKFFTPRSVARSMARLLPRVDAALVLDPSCGGGTFLSEASAYWGERSCTLLGNDIDSSLADLTRLRLALDPLHRASTVEEQNIFEPGALSRWAGTADAILANPPFSLRITMPGFESPLFAAGYATSDALFLDEAYSMLRPGGRLVCLLPHSIFANQEYSRLRRLINDRWALRAVVGLPEGVFHLTADTSTRAGVVVLDRRPCSEPSDVVFAHCSSVGIALNARGLGAETDELEAVVADSSVRRAMDLEEL
jgi:SAM-dependent methyltransferase